MAAKREPRKITIAEIEQRFPLDRASYWWGDRWCPAVACDGDGYSIRVVAAETVQRTRSGEENVNTVFDYFYLDSEGVITTAPRGYARDYKPGRVVDIDAAVERFAVPDPDAVKFRIGGGW